MLGNFSLFFNVCWQFSKLTFSKKFFQEHNQSVKQFGSRSEPMLCRSWSGSKLFAKVISRRQNSPGQSEEKHTLSPCMLGNCSLFFDVCWQFSKLTFSTKSFRNTIRVSNGLDPDQDRHYVGPDLSQNCLQRLSADHKICRGNLKRETYIISLHAWYFFHSFSTSADNFQNWLLRKILSGTQSERQTVLTMIRTDIMLVLIRVKTVCKDYQQTTKYAASIWKEKHTLSFCMMGNFSLFFDVCWQFSKLTFSKNSFRNTIRVSSSLDPDQDRHYVSPDLGPNCFISRRQNLQFFSGCECCINS